MSRRSWHWHCITFRAVATRRGKQTPTIMVVEDNDDVRDMMAVTLQLEGLEVITAANGRQALDLLRRGAKPCMIILDLMMPVMNGWEFQAELAREPKFGKIPVVVVSAATAEALKQTSAAAVIPKPIDVEKLLDVVCDFCDGTPAH